MDYDIGFVRKRRIISQDDCYFAAPAASGALGLQTNCTAFWQFENASWIDELGVNNLTSNGSPTTTAGVVGNAADLTAASTFLSHADAVALSIGAANSSFSISCWMNAAGAIQRNGITKNDGGFNNIEFWVGTRFTTANKWSWSFYAASSVEKFCTSTVNFSIGWHHIVATWDGTTQTIYVDGAASGTNTPAASSVDSTSNFFIGKDGVSGTFGAIKADQVGLWKGRVLNSTEVGLLYNSGAGLSWAAMA